MSPGPYIVTDYPWVGTTMNGYLFCMRQGTEFTLVRRTPSKDIVVLGHHDLPLQGSFYAHSFKRGVLDDSCERITGQIKITF